MGSYFTRGASRKNIIAELTQTFSNSLAEGGIHTVKVLAKAFVGNNMWVVHETSNSRTNLTGRFICLYILMRSSDGWGYKPISEDMGPADLSCPLAFIELVKDSPSHSYGINWRERVKTYHAKIKEVREKMPSFIQGKIPLKVESWNYIPLSISKGGKTFIGQRQDGKVYRINFADVSLT